MLCVAFVLAAGNSSRMKSGMSKISMPLCGRPVLDYALQIAHYWAKDHVYTVLSPTLAENHSLSDHIVVQSVAKGTGDAFALAFQEALSRDIHLLQKFILVLFGDVPLLQEEDVRCLVQKLRDNPEIDAAIASIRPPDPTGYGRMILNEQGILSRIIEEKNLSESEKSLGLCNSSLMCLRAEKIFSILSKLQPDALTGEIYLTDLIPHMRCAVIEIPWQSALGINTLKEFSKAESILQDRFREKAFQNGVLLLSPEHIFLSYDTEIEKGTIIHPFTFFGPKVKIDSQAEIFSFSSLSHCHIKKNARIGPFAQIRHKSLVCEHAQVGSFVELKNTVIGAYSQAKHLSYLGDATIGQGVNIGASVVTCNYDGHKKYTTVIDDNAFIGAHSSLIAPVHLGKDSTVGAGSVITQSVPEKSLALSRTEQKNTILRPDSKHLTRKKKGK
jgi:bifunctional UDP-N-acetylglucosamine pyrophosphorylase/glucosamine-1-phosphate N-acetyltransferase